MRKILYGTLVGLAILLTWNAQGEAMNFLFKNKQYSFLGEQLIVTRGKVPQVYTIIGVLASDGRYSRTSYAALVPLRTAQRRERAGDEFLGQGDAVGAMVYSNSTILNWLDKAFLSLQAPETP